jgi:preprotein translocase subunit Sss1
LTIKKSEAIQELNSSYLVKPSRREFVKILKIKDLGKSTIFMSYNSK